MSVVENETGGDVYVLLLNPTVEFMLSSLIIPAINKKFAAGLPIPDEVGFTWKNAKSKNGNGFIAVGFDFDFDPPFLNYDHELMR